MIIISSDIDIITYVGNYHRDACEVGLEERLVTAIQTASHPAYGEDWEDWLDEHAKTLKENL